MAGRRPVILLDLLDTPSWAGAHAWVHPGAGGWATPPANSTAGEEQAQNQDQDAAGRFVRSGLVRRGLAPKHETARVPGTECRLVSHIGTLVHQLL